MRGSIVKRTGKRGDSYFIVINRRWRRIPDPQSQAHADACLAEWMAQHYASSYVAPTRLALAEFTERWKEAHYPHVRPNTRKVYDSYLAKGILPHLGARPLTAITHEALELWRSALLKDYEPATVRGMMACLRIILSTAVRWRHLAASPAAEVARPALRPYEIRPLSPDEFQRLLMAAPDLQWRALLLMTTTGGLRLGEVIAARWRYLDLEARTYRVQEAWSLHGKTAAQPKTADSQQPVCLSPAACRALAALRGSRPRDTADSFLFQCQGPRVHYTPRTLQRKWDRLQVKAGVPHRRFHDLRHTCAALLIEQGAHAKTVQEQMRHANISMTLDTYGHLFPQRQAREVDRLDDLLGLADSV